MWKTTKFAILCFMIPIQIKTILNTKPSDAKIEVSGWVRTVRDSKNLVFIHINDGSCFSNLQLTFDRTAKENAPYISSIDKALKDVSTGASIKAQGRLAKSVGAGQSVELLLEDLQVLGKCPPSYPIQKKAATMEFLRDNAHLRGRTNTFGAVFRMRSQLAYALHTFFQERGFFYINTPEITCSDCEGAGEMFGVTTLSPEDLIALGAKVGRNKDLSKEEIKNLVSYKKDFFGKKANLTVSGQLEAETLATSLGRVYTFGPTFRAENSNTTRHISEFWMCEPEMAFFDLEDNMDIQEEFIKYLLKWALDKCPQDMEFFEKRVKPGVKKMLQHVIDTPFVRVSYTEAMKELEKEKSSFSFSPYWGCDLQTEHERFLTEKVYKSPVMVYDYPKEIKAFYMKLNPDEKTVRAVDVLVPELGEIIGGSQREEDYDKLFKRIEDLGLSPKDYDWYLDLRRFGTVPHSGFGLGFERLLMYVTGIANIRDVIPFPRAPGLADF